MLQNAGKVAKNSLFEYNANKRNDGVTHEIFTCRFRFNSYRTFR